MQTDMFTYTIIICKRRCRAACLPETWYTNNSGWTHRFTPAAKCNNNTHNQLTTSNVGAGLACPKPRGVFLRASRPRPFYVVFQIIGSYFYLSDIKNQTISFFVSFFKAYDTSAEDFFDLWHNQRDCLPSCRFFS